MSAGERYRGNLGAFTVKELEVIGDKSVCIIGCGGLGGFVANSITRFGVARITLVDGDVYSVSNLNRQMFSSPRRLGMNKAEVVGKALDEINTEVNVLVKPFMLTEENALELIKGHDIVMDCLDNIETRFILAEACAELNIPIIHGAISGLYGQVSCLFPGEKLFYKLYPGGPESQTPTPMGTPVFTPQVVAALQSCEAIKIMAGRETRLRNAVMYIDLNTTDFELVKIEE